MRAAETRREIELPDGEAIVFGHFLSSALSYHQNPLLSAAGTRLTACGGGELSLSSVSFSAAALLAHSFT